ncbi:hypothetical protein ACFP1C_12375 [Levilactobacillus fujinensis]|uniref:Uncharacterized protein n=1 Tax=Levilactobacillus fujinensis TaxID=2486024 RepID=A0ABW1TKL4_9LACO
MLVGTTILILKLGDLGQSSPYRSADMGWNGANTTRSFENIELPSLGFNLQLVILESIKRETLSGWGWCFFMDWEVSVVSSNWGRRAERQPVIKKIND